MYDMRHSSVFLSLSVALIKVGGVRQAGEHQKARSKSASGNRTPFVSRYATLEAYCQKTV